MAETRSSRSSRSSRPQQATLHWDDEAWELDIILDGNKDREGVSILTEVYIRVDPETRDILSVSLDYIPPARLLERNGVLLMTSLEEADDAQG